MLKRIVLATAVTGLIAGIALPVQISPAQAQAMTCKEAAEMKYPDDRAARRAFKKECKAAFEAQNAPPASEEPTYAGDI